MELSNNILNTNHLVSDEEAVQLWTAMHAKQYDWLAPIKRHPDFTFHIEVKHKIYSFGTKSGLIFIDGPSKSRKSTLAMLMVAATLRPDRRYMNIFSGIERGTVIYIDTEQTEIEFQYFQRTLGRICNWDPAMPSPYNYRAFHLRPYSHNERKALLKLIFKSYSNIKLVVLDGIADMVTDSNDQVESNEFVTLLTQLCDFSGATLLTQIHTTKLGNSPTGHLGGYLSKKCSAHIRTKLEGEETKVTCVEVRGGKSFPDFLFGHHESSMPCQFPLNFLHARPIAERMQAEAQRNIYARNAAILGERDRDDLEVYSVEPTLASEESQQQEFDFEEAPF